MIVRVWRAASCCKLPDCTKLVRTGGNKSRQSWQASSRGPTPRWSANIIYNGLQICYTLHCWQITWQSSYTVHGEISFMFQGPIQPHLPDRKCKDIKCERQFCDQCRYLTIVSSDRDRPTPLILLSRWRWRALGIPDRAVAASAAHQHDQDLDDLHLCSVLSVSNVSIVYPQDMN